MLPWEEVLCDGFDLALLNLTDRNRNDMHVSLLLRVTRWGLYIRGFILSTSCHRSYCITLFLQEPNTLDACWIAVNVWSNSSRCRQQQPTNLGRDAHIMIIALDIILIICFSVNSLIVICLPTLCYFLERSL